MKNVLFTLGLIFFTSYCSLAQESSTGNSNEQDQESYQVIETTPAPEGGVETFYEIISEMLKYPTEAVKNGIEGVAYIQFVVQPDGSVSSVEAVEGKELGYGIEEEAIRIIKLTRWVPGTQNGMKIPVRLVMPIRFKLPD